MVLDTPLYLVAHSNIYLFFFSRWCVLIRSSIDNLSCFERGEVEGMSNFPSQLHAWRFAQGRSGEKRAATVGDELNSTQALLQVVAHLDARLECSL